MGSAFERAAAWRRAPVVANEDYSQQRIVYRIQCPVTATSFAIPTAWRDKYVSTLVYSGSIDANGVFQGPYGQIAFANAQGVPVAPPLLLNQTVNFTQTGSTQSGFTLLNGVREEFYIAGELYNDARATSGSTTLGTIRGTQSNISCSIICSSTGGFFEITLMQGSI